MAAGAGAGAGAGAADRSAPRRRPRRRSRPGGYPSSHPAVALDTYKNSANPSNNFVGITDGPSGTTPDLLHWIATATLATSLRNVTHHVKVLTAGGTLTVSIDGTQVLSQAVTLPSSAYLGFSGGSGGSTDRHAISHLVVG